MKQDSVDWGPAAWQPRLADSPMHISDQYGLMGPWLAQTGATMTRDGGECIHCSMSMDRQPYLQSKRLYSKRHMPGLRVRRGGPSSCYRRAHSPAGKETSALYLSSNICS